MTTERPEADALCRFVNGAERPIDVHVNYHDEAYATVTPEEDQPTFSVDSDADGVYGTYTFEARAKDDPDGAVLAAVSVGFRAGDCYTVAFHRTDDDYQLAAYETDFAPSGDTRFEIHHVGDAQQIDWRIAPKQGADPRIPADERGGTLERGQWQRAVDVTENEYRLEVLDNGEVVAFHPDLELEKERLTACYVVGDPSPDMGSDEKQAHVFSQRYQIPAGPPREDETTASAEPLTTTDDNQSIRFDVDPQTMYETNQYNVEIAATDPDGVVTGIGLDGLEPETGGVQLLDDTMAPAAGIGEPATASIEVSPNVPPGRYEARLKANPDGMGERATGTVPLTVDPVTTKRLWSLVHRYHRDGVMTDEVANELFALLRTAGAAPEGFDGLVEDVLSLFESVGSGGGDGPDDPGEALRRLVGVVSNRRGDGIDEAAGAELVTETEALLARRANE